MKLCKLDRELRRAWQLNEHLLAHKTHDVEPVRNRNKTEEGLKATSKRASKRAERQLARAVIQDELCPQRTHEEEQEYFAEVRRKRGSARATPDERRMLWQEAFNLAAQSK